MEVRDINYTTVLVVVVIEVEVDVDVEAGAEAVTETWRRKHTTVANFRHARSEARESTADLHGRRRGQGGGG